MFVEYSGGSTSTFSCINKLAVLRRPQVSSSKIFPIKRRPLFPVTSKSYFSNFEMLSCKCATCVSLSIFLFYVRCEINANPNKCTPRTHVHTKQRGGRMRWHTDLSPSDRRHSVKRFYAAARRSTSVSRISLVLQMITFSSYKLAACLGCGGPLC